MRISIDWLNEYVNIKKLDIQELADDLTFKSIEVDNIYNLADNLNGIVVGKVLDQKKHSKADDLKVVNIDIGEDKLQLVTSAINLKKDMLVPVATVGSKLASGIIINKAKIKGVESQGMLCRKEELNLGKSDNQLHALVLPDSCEVGQPISQALKLDDIVLDVDVMANRADLMGHYGFAREVAVVTNQNLKEIEEIKLPKENKKLDLEIKNQNFNKCKRFSALLISNIKIQESPEWLKSRLLAVGIRPINNIVDLTNYCMFDQAYVYHAFDYDKITGKYMNIRTAKSGEKIITLDEEERELDEGMIIIEDKKKIIDLPGIMGGLNSGIDTKTRNIVLITAADDAFTIRKTSRVLSLRSDAVGVIEKGINPKGSFDALIRAYGLLEKILPDIKLEKIIDIYQPVKENSKPVLIDQHKIEKLLGQRIEKKFIEDTFESLGIKYKKKKGGQYEVSAPIWRQDLNIEEDYIEEIARIFGLNNFVNSPVIGELTPKALDEKLLLNKKIKQIMIGLGYDEVCNFSFIGPDLAKKVYYDPESHITVKNPLSVDQSLMRQELVSSLLENTKTNLKNFDQFKIFELAKVYLEGSTPNEILEGFKLTGLISDNSKVKSIKDELFYKCRSNVETILNELQIFNVEYRSIDTDKLECVRIFDSVKSADLYIEDMPIGTIGEISAEVLENFDIKSKVGIIDLSFEQLVKLHDSKKQYKEFSKYPKIELDVCLETNKNLEWQVVKTVIDKTISDFQDIVEKIELFDIYSSKQLSKNTKRISFRVVFRDKTQTLKIEATEEKLEKIKKQIVKELGEKYSIKIIE